MRIEPPGFDRLKRTTMRIPMISAAVLSLSLGLAAHAGPDRYGVDANAVAPLTAADYVAAAGRDDLYEIQAAELAEQQGNSRAVRSAAAEILAGQKVESQAMRHALEGAGMALGDQPRLSERQTAMLGELHAAAGPDFDRVFVEQQRAVGEDALALHEGYARHGGNGVLKGAAHHAALMVEKRLSLLDGLPGA
jgi:putative membrane protein